MNKQKTLISFLKQCNLRDALIEISKASQLIFYSRNNDERVKNNFAFVDKQAKEHITLEGLAYATYLLLHSGATDHKRYLLSKDLQAGKILTQITGLYYEGISSAPLDQEFQQVKENEEDKGNPEYWLIQFMTLFNKTQLLYQNLDIKALVAKSFLIYSREFAHTSVVEPLLPKPKDLFVQEYGMNIEQYLQTSFVIARYLQTDIATGVISGYMTDIRIDEDLKARNPDLFSEEKYNTVLHYLSCNYQEYRELDKKLNSQSIDFSKLEQMTKRINPSTKKPFIRPKENLINKRPIYLLSSPHLLHTRLFDEGLFDFLDDYYAEKFKDKDKPRRHFRSYFGRVYQNYVETILKEVYGTDIVKRVDDDDVKSKVKKVDFEIEFDEVIYILEVKSTVLNNHSVFFDFNNIEKIQEQLDMIKNGVEQLKHHETQLSQLTTKKIIPILVLNKTSSLLITHNKEGSKLLKKTLTEKGLSDYFFRYLDFDKVEIHFDALKTRKFSLEDLAAPVDKASFIAINDDYERVSIPIGNKFFDETFDEVMTMILPNKL